MKISLTLLLSFFILPMVQAQQVQKCCGTSSSTFLLGSTNYARHTQCLYAPGDFTGATSGSIIRLYYRYGTSGVVNGNTLGDLSISLRQTTATAFGGVQFLTGLQSVLDVTSLSIAPGQSGNWFSIELDTPFLYDPTRSLVVDILFETSANTAFGTYATSGNTGRKIMSDSTASPTGETWDTLQDLGFDLDDGTGVSQRVLTDVMLYPNPAEARSELMWTAPLTHDGFITLTDLAGRTMMTIPVAAGLIRTSVDLTSMAKGMYLLQLRDATGLLYSERLVRE